MVRSFVSEWNRTRPQDTGRFTEGGGSRSGGYLGAVAWLEMETSRMGAPVSRDRIQSVMKMETRTTELRHADPLVQAIGHPFAFHDGTLQIRPNPRATARARAACCGGALTGVVQPPATTC